MTILIIKPSIENDGFCITIDEFYIKIDEFCIKFDEFCMVKGLMLRVLW